MSQNPYAAPPVSGSYPTPGGPARSDNGIGWTAVGLSWVLCVPFLPLAGAVLAVIALARKRFRPRWVVVVALLVALTGTALQIAVVANPDFRDAFSDGFDEGSDADDADDADDRDVNGIGVTTAKLRTGDCLDDPALRDLKADETEESTTSFMVTVHPCHEPHDFEVFAAFPIHAKDFPGQTGIERVVQRCFPAFRGFVGTSYGRSDFEVYYYGPTQQSWRLIQDKKITCLVGHPKRQVRGTLEDAER